jgi:hypothetical protein
LLIEKVTEKNKKTPGREPFIENRFEPGPYFVPLYEDKSAKEV